MKKKQSFFLEQEAGTDKVYIRTHLGRYLTADPAGNWKADAETKGPNEQFEIEAQRDGSWAIILGGLGQSKELRLYNMVHIRLICIV